MTSCETCDAGWTPNPDKTACGKIACIIAMLKLIVLQNSNKYKLYIVFETRVSDVLVMFERVWVDTRKQNRQTVQQKPSNYPL